MSLNLIAMLAAGTPLAASASPGSCSATISGAGTATSGSTTVTPSGGSGGYTYSWSTPGFTATSASSATTSFSRSLSNGEGFSGTATCTVTDRQNGRTTTCTVDVALSSSSALATGITQLSSTKPAHPAGGSGPYQDVYRCDVSNGSGSYTYSWSVTSGLGATIVGSSTSQSCTFQYNVGPADGEFYATFFNCHVTDTVSGQTSDASGGIVQQAG